MLLGKITLSGLRLLPVALILALSACDWVDNRPDINDEPVVFDDGPYKVLEGNKVAVPADIGPLANDRDGGNRGITAVLVKGPQFAAEGGFELHDDGSFVYVHDGSENYEDYFVYVANDGLADSEENNVQILITPVNDAPVITGQQQVALAEDSVMVLGPQVLKISDPDNIFPDDFSLIVADGDNYTHNGSKITLRENYFGPLEIPVVVNDGTDSSASFNLAVTVTPVNDAPVITGWNQALLTVNEDTGLPVTLDALEIHDVEGDPVTLQVQPGNGYAVVGNTVTAAPDWFGELVVDVQVTDGQDASTGKITVIVEPVNDPPWAKNDSVTTLEDTSVSIDVVQNDADPEGSIEIDKGSIIISKQPAHGSVSVGADGMVTYHPGNNFNGSDSFGYTVADIHGAMSREAIVTITVTPVNDAPVAENDWVSIKEDTPESIKVTGNDSDPDGTGDIIYKGSIEIRTPPRHGKAVPRSNGTVDYSPDANFYGKDKFTYRIKDRSGEVSNIATVNIIVDAVNDLPFADDDSANTDEDRPVTIRVTDGDTDVDGDIDRSSVTIVRRPSHGQAVARSRGRVTYTPAANYFGTDSFTYRVKDDEGGLSNTATVTVTVNSVNDPPQITGQRPLSVLEEGSLPITLGDLLVTDPDNSYPTGFTLLVQDGKNYTRLGNTIVPQNNFAGMLRVPVRVNDGTVNSNIFTLSVTVTEVNDAPVITGTPPPSVREDQRYSFVPIATDSDAGDILTFSIQNKPEWANFDTGTGALTGTPRNRDVGVTQGVVISVRDQANTEVALPPFDIMVINVNDAPTITGQPATTVDEGKSYSFIPTTSDPDGDSLTFSISQKPSWAAFDKATGRLSGTPGNGDVGVTRGIVISVADGKGGTATLPTFNLRVANVNDPPVISGAPGTSVAQGQRYSFTPTTSDPDGDSLTFSINQKPSWAAFDKATGRLRGIPGNSDVGATRGIVISVADGNGGTAALPAFDLRVTNVNDPPVISGAPGTSVAQGQRYSFIPTATDPDGDSLTFSINQKPSWAAFDKATGRLHGTPGNSDVGATRGIVISVADGNGGTAALPAFELQVTNANHPPVANPDNGGSTPENIPININVVSNDTDPDSNNDIRKDSIEITDPPEYGKVVVNADGTIDYQPEPGKSGQFSFKYTIQDVAGAVSNEATVTITVTDAMQMATVNHPPKTPGFCSMIPVNTSVDGTLSASDPDGDDAELRFFIKKQGLKGSAWLSVDGRFTYEPYPGVHGTDTFTYQVIDRLGEKTAGTVKVIIGNTRIMPLGDIITAGDAEHGYRAILRRSLIKDGYAIEFVGSQSTAPDRHEGRSGADITTDYVAARIPDWLADNPADVILLHLGSRDFAAGGDAAVSEAQIDNILAAVEAASPQATVLLARIIDQTPVNPEISVFNKHIADKARADTVIIVDQHGELSYPGDLADALRPNAAGYVKMAAAWREALEGILDRCP